MTDASRFVGSVPKLYDRHLGPVLFEPYARELATRVPRNARRVLEVAAGTGRVTRHLLAALPADAALLSTDLNAPMLDEARGRIGPDPRLEWGVADAQALPVVDGSFDVVVCQFGLMFIPDKLQAVREMRRALVPGGTLLASAWSDLTANPSAALCHQLAFETMASDPPPFMQVPFSMGDPEELRELARNAGFRDVRVDTVTIEGEAESAASLATGYTRGNPLWDELLERNIDAAAYETRLASALRAAFGDAPCRMPLSAHLLTAVA